MCHCVFNLLICYCVFKTSVTLSLLGFAVLPFLLIIEHREIRLIAALGDIMFLHSFQHSTARFMRMRAVRETAVFGEVEDILEITGNLFGLHIKCAKAFNAWRINEVT